MTILQDDVDFFLFGRCQYPVPSNSLASQETDCDKPAIARVVWFDENGDEQAHMLVCQEHLEVVLPGTVA